VESNPQPSPETDQVAHVDEAAPPGPEVDEGKVYLSAAGGAENVVVVGDKAAPGADSGEAGDADDAQGAASFGVDEDGSFVVVVPPPKVPKLIVVFHFPEGKDLSVEFVVPQETDDNGEEKASFWAYGGRDNEPYPPEWQDLDAGAAAPGGMTVAFVSEGLYEVAGGLASVPPAALVVVANGTAAAEAVTVADGDGEFVVQIEGTPGDKLYVFSTGVESHEQASAPVELDIPAR
jgi:hypothetical protein